MGEEEERFYSVKEFAELVGRSNQAIYQRLDKDLDKFVKRTDRRKMISEQALSLFGIQELEQELGQENQELGQENSSDLNTVVEVLREQLAAKDKQIEELNARLAEAQSMAQSVAQANAVLASQAQQLQAIETQERQEQRRRRWFRRS